MADNPAPLGAVGDDDEGQYLGSTSGSLAGDGWRSVWGFMDGLRGVTDRAEAITGDVAGSVENITGARRSVWELKNDQREAAQEQFLDKVTTLRGDNKQVIWAVGAVGLAAVVIFAR